MSTTKSPKSNHIQGKVQDPKAVGSAFKSLAKNWLAELLRHWMMRRTMAHLRVWRRHSGVSRSGARRRLGKRNINVKQHSFVFEGVRTYLRHVLKILFWEYGGKLIRKTRWKRLVDKELWICVLCPIIPENKGLPMHNRAIGVGKLATS